MKFSPYWFGLAGRAGGNAFLKKPLSTISFTLVLLNKNQTLVLRNLRMRALFLFLFRQSSICHGGSQTCSFLLLHYFISLMSQPTQGASEGGGGPQGHPLRYPLEDDVVQPGESVPQARGEPLAAGNHMKVSHLILWKVRSLYYHLNTV